MSLSRQATALERIGPPADAHEVQRTIGIHTLVAFVAGGVAVWLVLTFVGPLGNDASSRHSASAAIADLPAGPLDGSVIPAADTPTLPDGGPNAAALWVHDQRDASGCADRAARRRRHPRPDRA